MKEKILKTLHDIEIQRQIEIIYAVESGSRAWGFASPDSDYDIRFLYVNKPKWYFSILAKADNWNIKDGKNDLDFNGWDIKKALELLLKSNMSLYEWFNSPIVYIDSPKAQEFRKLSDKFWNKTSLIFSYAALARRNYKAYISGEDRVRAKKYLYILRTLAACLWIGNLGTFPPIGINKLAEMLKKQDKSISDFLTHLIETKKQGTELGIITPKKEINTWIEKNIDYYLTNPNKYEKPPKDISLLDGYFYRAVFGCYQLRYVNNTDNVI
ncbi:MAG: nucleotidyltransferase domain-containing protein [Endomicrobium sp.]|jgi:predicted nucleotidyltransferase|nr:nucleotidyltransferase domain-containing protein [Endomicrobium sp.]